MNALAKCENTINEMEILHMSWLNKSWHPDVLKNWEDEGCMPDIKRRLGYRLVMRKAEIPEKPSAGEIFPVKLTIDNVGFAAPANPRLVEIVLKNTVSGSEFVHTIDTDPRDWFGGETVTIERSFTLPKDLAGGEYTLMLRLSDPCEKLHDDPRYSIRLANTDIWDEETGSNNIANITITGK